MMNTVSPAAVIQAIKKHKKFLITTHVNPDPDALCSELAVAVYLRSLGKQVVIVNHENVPKRFGFLPGVRKIKGFRDQVNITYDAAIVVDCGDLDRIGKVRNILREGRVLINIDHHVTNDCFGDLNLVQPEASSTAEVLYDLLMKARCPLTKNLAMYLYVGIMTDTGSFRYENTGPRTHAIVAALMAFKFSVPRLYQKIYEAIPLADLKEFTKVMSHFDVFFDGKVICLNLSRKVLARFSEEFDLRDAIFKFLRAIKQVEVLIIFTEVDSQKTRVNFRSILSFDVAKLANEFQGGGHRRASGCILNKNVLEARKQVLHSVGSLMSAHHKRQR